MNVNLKIKIQEWWDNLDYDLKVGLMETVYPDEASLIEVEEMWNMMDWEERYEVYCVEEEKVELTDEEKANIIGDMEAHRIMVEGVTMR